MTPIDAVIKQIEDLKPIPQVVHKIMALAEDPRSSMSDISEVIIYDQAITANLLKVCNSAFFGLPQEIDSVHKAILYMGLEQVVDIVLMSSGSENLKGRQEGYGLDEGELWKASVASALISMDLAERKGSKGNHLIFTAALLKDIGKVVLGQHVAETVEKIRFLVSEKGFSFREAEKAVIGIDHAELGGLIAERWKFSPRMADIIRHHHMPSESSDARLETSIVNLADTLCMMLGIGVGSDGMAYRFHKDTMDYLGFTEKDFQEVIAGLDEKIRKVEELLQVH